MISPINSIIHPRIESLKGGIETLHLRWGTARLVSLAVAFFAGTALTIYLFRRLFGDPQKPSTPPPVSNDAPNRTELPCSSPPSRVSSNGVMEPREILYLIDLPDDVIASMAMFLPYRSIARLSRTCKTLNKDLYRNKIVARFRQEFSKEMEKIRKWTTLAVVRLEPFRRDFELWNKQLEWKTIPLTKNYNAIILLRLFQNMTSAELVLFRANSYKFSKLNHFRTRVYEVLTTSEKIKSQLLANPLASFNDIALNLKKEGRMMEAIEVACMFTDQTVRDPVICDIVESLCNCGYLEEALEAARLIMYTSNQKNPLLDRICIAFLKRNPHQANDFQKSVEAACSITTDPKQRHLLLVQIIEHLLTQQMTDVAISVAGEIPFLDSFLSAFFIICATYLNPNQRQEVIRQLLLKKDTLKNQNNSLDVAEKFIKAFLRFDLLENALEIAARIKDPLSQDNAHCLIIKHLLKQKQTDVAISVASEIHFLHWYLSVFAEICSTSLNPNQCQEAVRLLVLKKESQKNQNYYFELTMECINDLLRSDFFEAAVEVACTLKDQENQDGAFILIIKTYLKLNRPEKAFKIAQMIHQPTSRDGMIGTISEAFRKNNPLRAIYVALSIESSMIQGIALNNVCKDLLKRDYLLENLKFIDQIKESRAKDTVLQAMTDVLLEQGLPVDALLAASLVEDQQKQDAILISIARSLLKLQRPEEALQVISMIDDLSMYDAGLDEVSIPYAKQKNLGEAIRIAFRRTGYKTSILVSIFDVFLSNKSFQEALDMTYPIDDMEEKEIARFALVLAILNRNLPFEALEIAHMITDQEKKDSALQAISQNLLRNHQPDEAFEVAQKIIDQEKRDSALQAISKYLLQNNQPDRALEIVLKINNREMRETDLITIIIKFVLLDRLKLARELVHMIGGQEKKDAALVAIIQALKALNRLKEAIELALMIQDRGKKDIALHGLSRAFSHLKCWDDAFQVILFIQDNGRKDFALQSLIEDRIDLKLTKEFFQIALMIKDQQIQDYVLHTFVEVLLIERLGENALEAARIIKDQQRKDQSLLDITNSKLFSAEKGLEMVLMIHNPSKQAFGLQRVSIDYLNENKHLEALETALRITTPQEKTSTLEYLFKSILKTHSPQEARAMAQLIQNGDEKRVVLEALNQALLP